jgi:hypothetical protein
MAYKSPHNSATLSPSPALNNAKENDPNNTQNLIQLKKVLSLAKKTLGSTRIDVTTLRGIRTFGGKITVSGVERFLRRNILRNVLRPIGFCCSSSISSSESSSLSPSNGADSSSSIP